MNTGNPAYQEATNELRAVTRTINFASHGREEEFQSNQIDVVVAIQRKWIVGELHAGCVAGIIYHDEWREIPTVSDSKAP